MQRILTLMMALLAITLFSACGNSHTHAEEEAHEHGPETHTHSEVADTAGTYVDSTSAFFGDEHEHGPDTHEHGEEGHEDDDDGHAHGPETHEHDDEDQGHQ